MGLMETQWCSRGRWGAVVDDTYWSMGKFKHIHSDHKITAGQGRHGVGTDNEGELQGYTREQMAQKIAAWKAQAMMAHSSDATIKHLVSSTNAVWNFNVSVPAISNAKLLLGLDLGGIWEKCLGSDQVQCPNMLPFLSLPRDINFGSSEFLPIHLVNNYVIPYLKYSWFVDIEGSMVHTCLVDMEFACSAREHPNSMSTVISPCDFIWSVNMDVKNTAE